MNSQPPIDLILASTSVYRRRLLERLALPFRCQPPEVDEIALPGEAPPALALRLGSAKALAVAKKEPQAWVIGSDQVAAVDGHTLGKPGNAQAAAAQLALCSERCVRFFTAVSLARGSQVVGERCVETRVQFRRLSSALIDEYIARDQPLDCAGSFRCEGLGIALFTALASDDPTALEGLPLIATVDLLSQAGIGVFATATVDS